MSRGGNFTVRFWCDTEQDFVKLYPMSYWKACRWAKDWYRDRLGHVVHVKSGEYVFNWRNLWQR